MKHVSRCMIAFIGIILLAAGLFGMSDFPPEISASEDCPPGMYSAAIDNLGGVRRLDPAWTLAYENEDVLKEFSDRLDAIEKWAETLEDACERKTYLDVVWNGRESIARYRGALALQSTMTKPPPF